MNVTTQSNGGSICDRIRHLAQDKLTIDYVCKCGKVALQSALIAVSVPVLFITSGAVPLDNFNAWLNDASSTQYSLEAAQSTVDDIFKSELFAAYVD